MPRPSRLEPSRCRQLYPNHSKRLNGPVISQNATNTLLGPLPLEATACCSRGKRYCSLLAAAAMHFSLVSGDMLSSSIGKNENSSGRAPPPGNLNNAQNDGNSSRNVRQSGGPDATKWYSMHPNTRRLTASLGYEARQKIRAPAPQAVKAADPVHSAAIYL